MAVDANSMCARFRFRGGSPTRRCENALAESSPVPRNSNGPKTGLRATPTTVRNDATASSFSDQLPRSTSMPAAAMTSRDSDGVSCSRSSDFACPISAHILRLSASPISRPSGDCAFWSSKPWLRRYSAMCMNASTACSGLSKVETSASSQAVLAACAVSMPIQQVSTGFTIFRICGTTASAVSSGGAILVGTCRSRIASVSGSACRSSRTARNCSGVAAALISTGLWTAAGMGSVWASAACVSAENGASLPPDNISRSTASDAGPMPLHTTARRSPNKRRMRVRDSRALNSSSLRLTRSTPARWNTAS